MWVPRSHEPITPTQARRTPRVPQPYVCWTRVPCEHHPIGRKGTDGAKQSQPLTTIDKSTQACAVHVRARAMRDTTASQPCKWPPQQKGDSNPHAAPHCTVLHRAAPYWLTLRHSAPHDRGHRMHAWMQVHHHPSTNSETREQRDRSHQLER